MSIFPADRTIEMSSYTFVYDNLLDGIHREEMLESVECEALTRRGKRCGRRVSLGIPECWQHTGQKRHLWIRTSTMPGAGLGLFYSDRSQPVNSFVTDIEQPLCRYEGRLTNQDDLMSTYGANGLGPYVCQVRRGDDDTVSIDAACWRSLASMINHSDSPNCHITADSEGVVVRTLRRIRNGEELFVRYSNERLFPSHVRHQTIKRSLGS